MKEMTKIFRKKSNDGELKESDEVKFRIEETLTLETKVVKKILDIKETLTQFHQDPETLESRIFHESREFEPIDISIDLCDALIVK